VSYKFSKTSEVFLMITLIISAITQNFGAPILFPVIWLYEGLELNKEMTGVIKKDLINVLLYLDIVQWTLGEIIISFM
jgi:hypothetical protein